MDGFAVIRLYCLSGNDFNNGTNNASVDKLLKTYIQWRQKVGDLSSLDSVLTLYYLCFLRTVRTDGCIPTELETSSFMSSQWRIKARRLIASSTRTKTTYDVLPQDEDIGLHYRRAVQLNCKTYWMKTLHEDLTNLPCHKGLGYIEDGSIMLCDEQDIDTRTKLIAKINARCGCGKNKDIPCCQTNRCSCRKAGKKCDSRCRCTHKACRNSYTTRQSVAEQGQEDEAATTGVPQEQRSDPMDINNLLNRRERNPQEHPQQETHAIIEDMRTNDDMTNSDPDDQSVSQPALDDLPASWQSISDEEVTLSDGDQAETGLES